MRFSTLSPSAHWGSFSLVLLAPLMTPVTLMFGEMLTRSRGEWMSGEVPSIGAAALALFFTACLGLLWSHRALSLRTRVSEFQQALPVLRSDVLKERIVLASAVLAVPVVLTTLGLLVLRGRSMGADLFRYGDPWPFTLVLGAAAMALVASVTAVVCFYAFRSTHTELSQRDTAMALVISLAVTVLPIVFVPMLAIPIHAVVGAFAVAELKATRDQAHDTSLTQASAQGLHPLGRLQDWLLAKVGPVRWVLFRSTLGRPSMLVMYGASLLVGVGSAVRGDGDLFVPLIALAVGLEAANLRRNVLEGLDPLPVTRARLYHWLLLPTLVVPVVVAGLGSTGAKDRSYIPGLPRHEIRMDSFWFEDREAVLIPRSLWVWAEGPAPATIQSPWGEEWQPAPVKWAGIVLPLHNPYGATGRNSVRFARWQLARACQAAGRPVSEATLQAEFLPGVDPGTQLSDVRYSDRTEWRASLPRGPWYAQFFGLNTLILIIIWAVAARFHLRSTLPTRAPWKLLYHSQVRSVVVLAPLLFFVVAGETRWDFTADLAKRGIQRVLGESPLVWPALSFLLAALLYHSLYRVFSRTETPPQQTGHGLFANTSVF